MDFTNRYDQHKRHEYSAYGKINKLLIPVIYNSMCEDIPYYTLRDSEYNIKESTLEHRLYNVYSHYYPYTDCITIDVEIMRWYDGRPSPAYNYRKTLFHKNVGRLNIIHKEKHGYIVKTITLKRMVPLLGKVKDIPYFKS